MTVKTKNPNTDMLFASISRRWPNAVKYITKIGILKAFHEGNHYITLDTWEFEAKECETDVKCLQCRKSYKQKEAA